MRSGEGYAAFGGKVKNGAFIERVSEEKKAITETVSASH